MQHVTLPYLKKMNVISKTKNSQTSNFMKSHKVSSSIVLTNSKNIYANRRSKIKESLSTFKLPPQVILEEHKEKADQSIIPFTIEILSNWGNPDNVKITSIWFLDKEKSFIKPELINSYPKINNSELEKVSRRVVPDLKSNDIFMQKWPPEDEKTLSLVFFFNSSKLPAYVRIWNPHTSADSSVKDVIIKQGLDFLWKGEIPMGFVKDIPLSSMGQIIKPTKSEAIMVQLFPELAKPPEISNDKYGLYPVVKTQKIRLEIFSTWDNTNERFGLNALQFFDISFHPIGLDQIEDFFVENCASFTDPSVLIKSDPLTNASNEMFTAESDFQKPPAITIAFKQPVLLSQVVIWNYNALGTDGGVCVKDVKLRARRKLLWNGRARLSTGSIKGAPCCTTPIWLTDNPEIRKREFL